MGLKRTDEFRRDAVRIALTSGLTRMPASQKLQHRKLMGNCKANGAVTIRYCFEFFQKPKLESKQVKLLGNGSKRNLPFLIISGRRFVYSNAI